MSNTRNRYWGLELDRQLKIFEAAIDERIYVVSHMLLFMAHPEGRFEEADLTAEVAEAHELEPEDMSEVFDKHSSLLEQGLL